MVYSVPSQLSLFRQEAIDFQQQNRQWGQVALLQPLSTKIITWFIAAVVLLFVASLYLGQYARKETVTGYLTPAAGTAKIFAPQQGTIKAIYVKEGQQVEKEQPLLAVETSQIAASGEDINVSMLATLEAQRKLLTSQIAAEQERTKSEQARLTALIGGLKTEVSELQGQIESQKEAVRVSREIVASVIDLRARGLISALEFAQRELTALGQKQKQNSLNQELAARQNQLTETSYSLEQLPTVMAGKIQSLRSELATTEQRITEISGRRAYVIRAPDGGRISTLQTTVGQFANSRRPQMEIIPNDSALQAELFVPTRGIGFVQPGQKVRILYEAFPHQQFGAYGGRISEISQTILTGLTPLDPSSSRSPLTGSRWCSTGRISTPMANAYRSRPVCSSTQISFSRSARL